MMRSVYKKIILLVLVVLGIFTVLGHLVPQFTGGYPPAEATIKSNASPEELVKIGQDLVGTRGCLTCHTLSGTEKGRCPNLAGIGVTAATRYHGYNAEQYLLRRLTAPGFSSLPGYPNIMPTVWQPPIALTWPEIEAVTAYLESLGGKVTIKVTPSDLLDQPHSVHFPDGATVIVKKSAPQKAIDPEAAAQGRQVMMNLPEKERCITCHKIGKEMPVGWYPNAYGQFCPDLSQIGAMHDVAYVRRKIVNPQSLPAVTGYPKTMMPMDYVRTLQRQYGSAWKAKLDLLAEFVASHRGQQTLPPEISPWIIGGMLGISILLSFWMGRRKLR